MSEVPPVSACRLCRRARALRPGSELHKGPTSGFLAPSLGHPTKMSPITKQQFLFPPCKGREKKPVKEELRKNELGKVMSPQLCGCQTLPVQLLPPRHRGRAAKWWGGLGPSSAPEEIQTWGCLNLVLEHRTVAAQRCFQAKTQQQPSNKRC